MNIIVGVISFNTRPFLEIFMKTVVPAIKKAKKACPQDKFKIVVVDNGSNDGTKEFMQTLTYDETYDIDLIYNETNLGISPGWNQLIKAGYDNEGSPLYDYYMICNNDVYWTENSIMNFVTCLKQDKEKEYGWVSIFMNDYKEPELTGVEETVMLENIYWSMRPEADDVLNLKQLAGLIKTAYSRFDGIENFANNLKNKHGLQLKQMHPKAPLFALSKECIKQVGLFEEYNCPIGIHEDADYCQRIKVFSKLKFGAAYGAYVHHFSMMTRTRGELREQWVEGREKGFQEVWGCSSKEMHNWPTKNYKLRLDIGASKCMGGRYDGHWYHFDIQPDKHIEYLYDIAKANLPFDENSVDEILCSHTLEHTHWKNAYPIIYDWFNKLKSNGIVEIRVPNMRFLAENYIKGSWSLDLISDDLNIQSAIFGGAENCAMTHKGGYDFNALSRALKDAGFVDIKDTSDNGSWELKIVARKP